MGNSESFADTVTGKIVVGLVIAAGSAIMSWVVSRATYVSPPAERPVVQIVPAETVALANQAIDFSAAESTAATEGPLVYDWRISGLEPNRSPVARCTDKGATLSCVFVLPGTFAVSATATDASGQFGSAASAVTVSVKNGYFGLLLRSENPNAVRALMYDVDWLSLQSLISRPIVLIEPESNTPAYAAMLEVPEDTPDSFV